MIEIQVTLLLITAVMVAVAAKRIRVPYTVAMVLTGLLVSFLHEGQLLTDIHLEPHLILITFLPGLLFEAGYHLELNELKRNIRTILLFAIPGVIISMTIIGLLLKWSLTIPLIEALLFGILISATDPVAVTAIFKDLGVSKRLSNIVEGESLFNDGVAIVLFSILSSAATGQQAFTMLDIVTTFFVTVGGGAALGFGTGYLVSSLMRRTQDHTLELALTMLLAYGTYLLAEDIMRGAVSPVIAVVMAAVVVRDRTDRPGIGHSVEVIIPFWEFITFFINSALFLLIGLTVKPLDLIQNFIPVMISIGVILLARVVIAYTLRWMANRFIRPMRDEWGHVMFWGGLRGAVSIALALSLPVQLENHDLFITLTFGYALFSLIVQGLTIRTLIDKMGMARRSDDQYRYEILRAEMIMAHAATHTLNRLHDEHIVTRLIHDRLKRTFTHTIDIKWEELRSLLEKDFALADIDVRYVQREIIEAQKQALRQMSQRGLISTETARRLSHEANEIIERAVEEDWAPAVIWESGMLVQSEEIIGAD